MTPTIHELKVQAAELGLTPDDVRVHGILSKKATWQQAIGHKKYEIVSRQNSEETAVSDSVQNQSDEPNRERFEKMAIALDKADINFLLAQATEEDIAVTVNQPTLYECPQCNGEGVFLIDDNETGWQYCDFCDGKKFVTEQAREEYQQWEEEGGAVEMNQSTEIACLINHPALAEGELVEPSPGGFFLGKDDRDLPLYSGWVDSDENKLKIYPIYQPIPPITIPEISEKLSEGKYFQNFPQFATPLKDEFLLKMTTYIGDGITAGEFEALKDEPLDEYTAAVFLGWLEESERMVQEAVAA